MKKIINDKKLEEFTFNDKANIILTSKIQHQITLLHSKFGDNEWSGILFYKVLEGGLNEISNLKISIEEIFLMDIGNASATGYDFNESIIDAFTNIKDSEEMSYGLVHSHHNMETFFSNTDNLELHNNAGNYDFYLSLIVNFNSKYNCKIAFETNIKNNSTYSYIDNDGKTKLKKATSSDKKLCIIDTEIYFESDEYFIERINTVEKEIKEKKVTEVQTYHNPNPYTRDFNNFDEEYYDFYEKSKSLHENIKKDSIQKNNFLNNNTSIDNNIKKFSKAIINLNSNKDESIKTIIDNLCGKSNNNDSYLMSFEDNLLSTYNKYFPDEINMHEIFNSTISYIKRYAENVFNINSKEFDLLSEITNTIEMYLLVDLVDEYNK